MPHIAPYGSWRSPITPAITSGSYLYLEQVQVTDGLITWLERRPAENRQVIVRRAEDDRNQDITPPSFNARSTLIEYGGGDYWLHGQTVFFTHFADQRLYRQPIGGLPQAITPEPDIPRGLRYADGRVTPDGRWIVCVRERHHPDREADTELVALPPDGSAEPRIIAEGHNFYSNPRVSPDGRRLLFLTWDHPNTPWDGSDLWAAELAADGTLSHLQHVAGGPQESIYQPEWGPDGMIYFCSDRTGWWNLHRWDGQQAVNLAAVEGDIGGAIWKLGTTCYAFLSRGRIACLVNADGAERFHLIQPGSGKLELLPLPFTASFRASIASDGDDGLVFTGGGPKQPVGVTQYRLGSGQLTRLREQYELEVDPAYLSEPQHITFPTTGGDAAHAFYYPPCNPDYQAPTGEKPPLIVMVHGGPTGHTWRLLDLHWQYWTSRGFAVVDMNYRGSTGYGRAYWKKLYGQWGVLDVDDCIAAAQYLVGQGLVDPARLAINGGSAGGYATLCALTFHKVFTAGSSWYGIGDMATMVRETHKYESRYCDMLVANTYPAPHEILHDRSPIHFLDQLSAPMILLQGAEDKIVPPNQAEDMARALDAKGLPYVLELFEGEPHGFRRAETLIRCLQDELYFYSKIFKFEPADQLEPVTIHNLKPGA